MNIRYVFFAILLIVLGGGLFLMPEPNTIHEKQAKYLLAELKDQTRFFTTDEVAERIINQDPSLFLVDVRVPEEYKEYTLPGAANIPLKEVLSPNWAAYLEQGKDVVFFSNSGLYAEQAWLLAKRKNYKNIYIMKGGLNKWFKTIIQPKRPKESTSSNEFDLYEFRKGACQYFTGGKLTMEDTNFDTIEIIRRKKKTVISGGC